MASVSRGFLRLNDPSFTNTAKLTASCASSGSEGNSAADVPIGMAVGVMGVLGK